MSEKRKKPLSMSTIAKGNRLLLQELDNTRFVLEVTSAGNGSATGKRIGPDGTPKGRVQKVSRWQILCLEGDQPIKHSGNLIPDDLLYDPQHRSGLQYCKAALIRGDLVGVVRWNEAKEEWTKRPAFVSSYKIEFLGRADNPDDLQAFFARIKEDRTAWLASPGRSAMVQVKGNEPGVQGWREKQRRWQGEGKAPVKMREPTPWPKSPASDSHTVTHRVEVVVSLPTGDATLPTRGSRLERPEVLEAHAPPPVDQVTPSWLSRLMRRMFG